MQTGFFKVLTVAQLLEKLRTFPVLSSETVSLTCSKDRVLAAPVVAREDLPMLNRSCMDGYAVRARDLFGASEQNPAYVESVGSVDIETRPEFVVEPGECASIVTGGSLPEGADAVVMVEYTQELSDTTVEVRKSLAPGEHVMQRGEDASAGEEALSPGRTLRAQEIGLLAALGVEQAQVARKPRVGIISTGDELIDISETPQPGQIRDVNSYALGALVEKAGAEPVLMGLVADNQEALSAALKKALETCDVVFLSGGSSVGIRDFTLTAVQEMEGSELLAHGVAISPGKPLILARVGDKAVWGLPGQVASAQVVMMVLGLPFLRHIQGDAQAFDTTLRPARRAVLGRNIASKPGREDYVRARLNPAEEEGRLPTATPVTGKSGLLRTMLTSHGLIRIPADSEGLDAGIEVDVWLV